MRRAISILIALAGSAAAEPSPAPAKWPHVVRDFPSGEHVSFATDKYTIEREVPNDPEIQAGGGSGGPIVRITVRLKSSGRTAVLESQSVGERLLAPSGGFPQLELWGRGGGGYWTRALYRFVSGQYRPIRYDEFEESPRHNNTHAATTQLPFAPHGDEDYRGSTVYYTETRYP